MRRTAFCTCTFLILLATLAVPSSAQVISWPLEPTDMEHPIGNTLGELVIWNGSIYHHAGVDILATPHPDPNAPQVVSVEGGKVRNLLDSPSTAYNEIQILDANGIIHTYQHLAYGTISANVKDAFNDGVAIGKGIPMAQVFPWSCSYAHLHYQQVRNLTTYLNPLSGIAPDPDNFAPQIHGIGFADRNSVRWREFSPPSGPACTVVSGQVDIIAQLQDQDDAGAAATVNGARNVGVYDLQWRVCPQGNTNCVAWNAAHHFSEMPAGWSNPADAAGRTHFSQTPNWVSTYDECGLEADRTFSVVTPSGWNTTAIPDGSYSVSVQASDIAGNLSMRSARACVQNGSACLTDLIVRDAEDDDGSTAYPGPYFWMSPDIAVNPLSATANGALRIAQPNVVEVRVHNTGSCALPAGTTYNVCLGWSQPSGYVPFPMSAAQTVGCQTQTVPAGGMAPGSSITTSFTWAPPSSSVPQGHACLVAWSNSAADPVQTTPSVIFDNNRAQRNIAFITLPDSADPGPSTSSFWIHPFDAAKRTWRLSFNSRGGPGPSSARLHVPPTVSFSRVRGAEIIGAYRPVRPRELCAIDNPTCRVPCRNLRTASRNGCTLVIGQMQPNKTIDLDEVVAAESAQLWLEVPTPQSMPRDAFFDAEIAEFATYDPQPPVPLGGLTLRFQGPDFR